MERIMQITPLNNTQTYSDPTPSSSRTDQTHLDNIQPLRQQSPQPRIQPVQRFLSEKEKNQLFEQSPALKNLVDVLEFEQHEGASKLEYVAKLLSDKSINANTFKGIAVSDPQGYTRNTIEKNERYELTALKWQAGQKTSIHDHKGSACAFRVLQGPITEVTYHKTDSNRAMAMAVGATEHNTGTVCAAADDDIHALHNKNNKNNEPSDALCLHLYMPPVTGNTTYQADEENR